MPSRVEGLPLAIIEGDVWSGRTVIANDVGAQERKKHSRTA